MALDGSATNYVTLASHVSMLELHFPIGKIRRLDWIRGSVLAVYQNLL